MTYEKVGCFVGTNVKCGTIVGIDVIAISFALTGKNGSSSCCSGHCGTGSGRCWTLGCLNGHSGDGLDPTDVILDPSESIRVPQFAAVATEARDSDLNPRSAILRQDHRSSAVARTRSFTTGAARADGAVCNDARPCLLARFVGDDGRRGFAEDVARRSHSFNQSNNP